MSEIHTFKIDDKYGVPDRLVREFLNECEIKMGLIRVFMHDVKTSTAQLLTVVVVPDELVTDDSKDPGKRFDIEQDMERIRSLGK